MEKISKAQVKFVRSLQLKKVRDAEGLFVAEGEKCVEELRRGFELVSLYREGENATRTEIEQMSSLKTPQGVIGVFKKSVSPKDGQSNGRSVSPKGNVGTIIRTCDWFGVHEIVCSRDTADCYNPKVVQATMGALARVNLRYLDLVEWLSPLRLPHKGGEQMRIYGTLLDGKNMYEVLSGEAGLSASKASGLCSVSEQSERSVIIMGNEGNGVSTDVRQLLTHKLLIPPYPVETKSAESLNVSIATAIICAEFRRRC